VSRIREGVELMLFLCGCWGAAFSFHCELPPVVEDTYDSVITHYCVCILFSGENGGIGGAGRVLSMGYGFLWKLFGFPGSNRLHTRSGLVCSLL
jgi:hypothetical protein